MKNAAAISSRYSAVGSAGTGTAAASSAVGTTAAGTVAGAGPVAAEAAGMVFGSQLVLDAGRRGGPGEILDEPPERHSP